MIGGTVSPAGTMKPCVRRPPRSSGSAWCDNFLRFDALLGILRRR